MSGSHVECAAVRWRSNALGLRATKLFRLYAGGSACAEVASYLALLRMMPHIDRVEIVVEQVAGAAFQHGTNGGKA